VAIVRLIEWMPRRERDDGAGSGASRAADTNAMNRPSALTDTHGGPKGCTSAFLFGLSGIDPVTYLVLGFVLVVASLVAALVPARRATRIDPLLAPRYE
jgi:ABC-type antimicrobial peptide transport system permease subunit